MRVMVVDDSKTIVKILCMLLEKRFDMDLEVVKCDSGEVALRKLEDIHVDLVLLDVVMEGIDGFETCRRIKQNPLTKDVTVIFLTSKSEEQDIIKGFEVGGVDYISKPFREAEFVARVKTQLELKKYQNKEIESTQSEVIIKMGEIGESRSEETANHVKRVAKYCYLLAHLYGLDEADCNLLAAASPMHDIGKVSTPDNILKKPGRLTDEERVEMQKHTTVGYELFSNSKGKILRTAAIVAHEHHEKYDGTGYPRGLRGNEIHIFGRIVAVADVFDALGSERVYKKAWELDKILKLLEEEKGKHFDPYLVDIFLENINQFLEIREKFKDI
ncbi:MAG: response regulator [Campylobacterales bacterium]|nr:response regulator [Campylobacterales bacterium]